MNWFEILITNYLLYSIGLFGGSYVVSKIYDHFTEGRTNKHDKNKNRKRN